MRTTATDDRSAGGISVGLDVHQNKYFSAREREQDIHAIATVRVEGSGGGGSGDKLAEVLVVDCSSSMTWPQEKFRAAKEAAVAVLRMLPDGTPFAVVQGTDTASTAYPPGLGHGGADLPAVPAAPIEADRAMPRADAGRRKAAEQAVHRLRTVGGTSIGTWLDLSRRLLAARPAPIRHVLLLTDGHNLHDQVLPLAGVLDACRGEFVCDCWGIGDDWDGRELVGIASALHGTANSVDEVADLADAYRSLMGNLLARTVPELILRVTPSPGVSIRFVKQVYPTEMELSGTQQGRSTEYVTRAWGDESRRFQICLTADPHGAEQGVDLQLAAMSIDVPTGADPVELPLARACEVHWTDDPALSGHVSAHVEHYEAHRRLGVAVGEALDAYGRGDTERTRDRLGLAVSLAHRLGAERQLDRLARLVEIDDAPAGRVRLRPGIVLVDFQRLITSTSHSTFGPGSPPAGGVGDAAAGADEPDVDCPVCGEPVPWDAVFCPHGGHPIPDRT